MEKERKKERKEEMEREREKEKKGKNSVKCIPARSCVPLSFFNDIPDPVNSVRFMSSPSLSRSVFSLSLSLSLWSFHVSLFLISLT